MCSSPTSVLKNGVLCARGNRDVRRLKQQYAVRNVPKKRLPAIADRSVRGRKKTKGQAGIGRGSVVEKVWKDIGGNQEEIFLSIHGRSLRGTRQE